MCEGSSETLQQTNIGAEFLCSARVILALDRDLLCSLLSSLSDTRNEVSSQGTVDLALVVASENAFLYLNS